MKKNWYIFIHIFLKFFRFLNKYFNTYFRTLSYYFPLLVTKTTFNFFTKVSHIIKARVMNKNC